MALTLVFYILIYYNLMNKGGRKLHTHFKYYVIIYYVSFYLIMLNNGSFLDENYHNLRSSFVICLE